MFPVLFHFDSFAIHSYGFFIALGYLVALFAMIRIGKKQSVSMAHLVDLAFFSLLAGLVGARILFVLTNFSYYWKNPVEIFYVWEGGLVFFGGILTAIPFLLFYIRRNKLPVRASLDILAVGLSIGHAFGRIGCLGAGCCHGKACDLPWAIKINSDLVDPLLRNTPIHPTQIYEAASLFILFIFLWQKTKHKIFNGQVALLYLMSYAVIRSIIEMFRGDSIRGFLVPGLVSTSQCISLLTFALAFYFYRKWLAENRGTTVS